MQAIDSIWNDLRGKSLEYLLSLYPFLLNSFSKFVIYLGYLPEVLTIDAVFHLGQLLFNVRLIVTFNLLLGQLQNLGLPILPELCQMLVDVTLGDNLFLLLLNLVHTLDQLLHYIVVH